jgi:hypothetical protein
MTKAERSKYGLPSESTPENKNGDRIRDRR